MDHLVVVGFLVYAALFRLAIIATGVAAIVLGYKLFLRGVMGEGGTNVNAEAGPIKLTLHNAGPGGVFALFGAGIIIVMLSQGSPELLMKDMSQLTVSPPDMNQKPAHQQASQPEKRDVSTALQIRGENNDDKEWSKLNENVTMSEAAEPLSSIARVWLQEKRTGEAVAMARLAAFYGSEKDKANYHALLGEALFENGDKQNAVSAMQKAAERDPLYRAALARMQERLAE
ncbi:MAG: hypothetical protein CDV28_10857 [Candidatus Electronema aureum]|uniref:Uncharacterized protein n=1 Tax=Candidatus Electronema aureum TaxID=2005002 RepID=A0A521G2S8_9BACT|nr:MAG: hypothetical protein CDV28_10857 [Candidatus Electronema aureum]